ncbi:MAG: hypothetical protein CSA21_07075, partial [Deltaproteobacteria bacterium]
LGRRVQKTTYAYRAGTWVKQSTKKFVYDGWHLIAELNEAGEGSFVSVSHTFEGTKDCPCPIKEEKRLKEEFKKKQEQIKFEAKKLSAKWRYEELKAQMGKEYKTLY